MLSLPQTMTVNNTAIKGESAQGIGADARGDTDRAGFAATLRASAPAPDTEAGNTGASGDSLPQNGNNLPHDQAGIVTNSIKDPLANSADAVLLDAEESSGLPGLDLAALMKRLANGEAELAAIDVNQTTALTLPERAPGAASSDLAGAVTMPDVPMNELPDALDTLQMDMAASAAALNNPQAIPVIATAGAVELAPDLALNPAGQVAAVSPLSRGLRGGYQAMFSQINGSSNPAALQQMRVAGTSEPTVPLDRPGVGPQALITASPAVAETLTRGNLQQPLLSSAFPGVTQGAGAGEALPLAQAAPSAEAPVTVRPETAIQGAQGLRGKQNPYGVPAQATLQNGSAMSGMTEQVSHLLPKSAKADAGVPLVSQVSFTTLPGPASGVPGATPTPTQALNVPVTDNAWGNALSERIVVLAGQKLTSADIRLNPVELGPLRVEIKVDDGNAQIHFTAQHAATRDAIEQALPRLREQLSAEGLNLTGADVSEHGVRQDQADESQAAAADSGVEDGGEAAETDAGSLHARARVSEGLVDTFA